MTSSFEEEHYFHPRRETMLARLGTFGIATPPHDGGFSVDASVRIEAVFPLCCPECGGDMRIIASIPRRRWCERLNFPSLAFDLATKSKRRAGNFFD